MTDRRVRPEGGVYDQAAYHRVMQKVEEGNAALASRMEHLFDRINERLDRVDRDLASKEQADDIVKGELRELKRDLGELRDAAAIVPQRVAPAYASSVWKTWGGKFVAAAVGITAVLVMLGSLPDAARGWDRFWAFLRGADQVEAHSKQDTTDGR